MFTSEYVATLVGQSVLTERDQDGSKVYCLNSPSKIVFAEDILDKIKTTYKPDEEIGGIFWVRPGGHDISTVGILNICNVSFIRNAIEDNPRQDHLNKKNAYLLDKNDFSESYSQCINDGCIPMKFHTHPTNGIDFQAEWRHTINNWETSDADIRESDTLEYSEPGLKIILPRVLIVGYGKIEGEFFYGVYGGLVSPQNFKDSKEIIKKENLNKIFETVQEVKITDQQKIAIGIGVILLIALAVKYRKNSIPILLSLAAIAPAFLLSTNTVESPKYYNKTNQGRVEIFIP